MTDDLVKRLRSPEVFIDTGGMFSPVAHQAADRIEQLEAALRKLDDMVCELDAGNLQLFEVGDFIDAALAGEKKDD
jgi:hypothetical protein